MSNHSFQLSDIVDISEEPSETTTNSTNNNQSQSDSFVMQAAINASFRFSGGQQQQQQQLIQTQTQQTAGESTRGAGGIGGIIGQLGYGGGHHHHHHYHHSTSTRSCPPSTTTSRGPPTNAPAGGNGGGNGGRTKMRRASIALRRAPEADDVLLKPKMDDFHNSNHSRGGGSEGGFRRSFTKRFSFHSSNTSKELDMNNSSSNNKHGSSGERRSCFGGGGKGENNNNENHNNNNNNNSKNNGRRHSYYYNKKKNGGKKKNTGKNSKRNHHYDSNTKTYPSSSSSTRNLQQQQQQQQKHNDHNYNFNVPLSVRIKQRMASCICFLQQSQRTIKGQLMFTFGIVLFVTIVFICIICVLAAFHAQRVLESGIVHSFSSLNNEIQGRATRYLAEDLALKLIPIDLIQIIHEATQDRFMGYPDAPGYNIHNDQLTPFGQTTTTTTTTTTTKLNNQYPIVGKPLPLDWQLQPNVNETNYIEHVGSKNRYEWYRHDIEDNKGISTASASYYVQGMCDPSLKSPYNKSMPTYFPNCKRANNDMGTGGVVAPTSTNYEIYRRSADLTPLLKSLYEFNTEIRSLGIFYMNNGAGASFQFPHYQVNTKTYYESKGCDWLLNTKHPIYYPTIIQTQTQTKTTTATTTTPQQQFKTKYNYYKNNNFKKRMIVDTNNKTSKNNVEILNNVQNQAICRTSGTTVSSRVYNPLERDWCRDQAQHPNKVRVFGPYNDAFHDDLVLITVGKAIYDRLTNEFLACVAVDYVLDAVNDMVINSKLLTNNNDNYNYTKVTIVRNDKMGTIVASSSSSPMSLSSKSKVHSNETQIGTQAIRLSGIWLDAYHALRNVIDYQQYNSTNWKLKDISLQYENFEYEDNINFPDYHITGYPIPSPPEIYDPEYEPEFMALVMVYQPQTTALRSISNLCAQVKHNTHKIVIISVIACLVGLGILLGVLFLVSYFITAPLQFMNDAAQEIIGTQFGDDEQFNDSNNANNNNNNKGNNNNNDIMKQNGSSDNESAHFRLGVCDGDGDGENPSSFDDEEKAAGDGAAGFGLGGFGPGSNNQRIVNKQKRASVRSAGSSGAGSSAGGGGFSVTPFKYKRYIPERCAPKTELNEVVRQFEQMLSQFTSSSYASSMKVKVKEFRNEFGMENDFDHLYKSRKMMSSSTQGGGGAGTGSSTSKPKQFKYSFDFDSNNNVNNNNRLAIAQRLHFGRNVKDGHNLDFDVFEDDTTNKSPRPSFTSNKRPSSNMGDNTTKRPSVRNSFNKPPRRRSSRKVNDSNQIAKKAQKKGYLSSLFVWVMLSTAIPFVLIATSFSTVIMTSAFKNFEWTLRDVKDSFLRIETEALEVYVEHRSRLASELMEKPVRDLHVLTRYAGWLLAGGIDTAMTKTASDSNSNSNSIREIISNIEECRQYDSIEQCDAWQDRMKRCDCSWNDFRVVGTCTNATNQNSRYDQTPFFIGQSQDVWPQTGDRNTTSYPQVSYSAQTTEWYRSIAELPGKGTTSTTSTTSNRYHTAYDRWHSLSSIPIFVPLYNQDNQPDDDTANHARVHLGSFVAMENDGHFIGYAGCAYPGHEIMSHFTNPPDTDNLFPQNICPAGKFGFDPRCREWYQYGKISHEKNNTNLYVTPPYNFASSNEHYAQSATSPIVVNGQYLGQTLIDFIITPMLDAFSAERTPLRNDGFPILIAATDEFYVEDTIIGPGFTFANPTPITDVVYADDVHCSRSANSESDSKNATTETTQNIDERCKKRRSDFNAIVAHMKAGGSGTEKFRLAKVNEETGEVKHETYHIVYGPVKVQSLAAVDNSDFSRGVHQGTNALVYSIALVETESALTGVFEQIAQDIQKQCIAPLVLVLVVVAFVSLLFIFISYHMAKSISEPILYLLDMIGKINGLDSYGNAPVFDMNRKGLSLEVINVSKTIESLYNVISCANIAFFAGDLDQAYQVLTDVLIMYRKLENKKGISIACNNLGNTMLTMYRTMEKSGDDRICGFNKRRIITKGTAYFHEAIKLGEKAYDNYYEAQGWSPNCLEFMQHLSNRYFNRAMFLLTIKKDHLDPVKIEELGLRDLEIARDMDLEIVEEGKQAGWGVRTQDRLFDVTLSRVRGHLLLLQMGYADDWELQETLDNAFQTVRMEMQKQRKNPHFVSSLFTDITPAGRMQQIETELMRYKLIKGDTLTAAKIAVRCLVEDDYTLQDAHLNAVEVLIKYMDSPACAQVDRSTKSRKRKKNALLEYQNNLIEFTEESSLFFVKQARAQSMHQTLSTYNPSSTNQESTGLVPMPDFTRRQSKMDVRSSFSLKESARGDVTMESF